MPVSMRVCAALLMSATVFLSDESPDSLVASTQAGIAGAWRSDSVPGWTLVLKTEGARLTGAVSTCSSSPSTEIFDALIDGDGIAFKCRSADGDRTLAFTGRVTGGAIDFRWELQVRDGGRAPALTDQFSGSRPRQFTAKRAPDGAGETLLAIVSERIRTTRPAWSPVTFERILQADREPHNWLTYSGNVFGQRHSALTQITPGNVSNLELTWIWPSQSTGQFEATPLVVDGVLYTVQAPNDVVALDAISGVVLWTHAYTPAPEARATGGGGRPNRGLAILGETLFMGTLDAHLLAINARTGALQWNTTVANAADPACRPPDFPPQGQAPCYVLTHAPLVVKDKVIVGTGGGDGGSPGYGIRGFVAAFDVTTGKEVWRFSTIPAPGQPGHETWSGDSWKTGGAGAWMTGAYDPDLNLIYWGTGNPVPTANGATRLGDNLYSDSVVALDADTGLLKWHYQFTPHDEVDWDAAQVPVLTEMEWQGRPRKVILWANKNGLMYVLDRTTGQLLSGKPFVDVNWMDGFDERGRPVLVAGRARTEWIPSRLVSGTNWWPSSYSPRTGLFYIPATQRTGEGPGNGHGAVLAFDPRTGEKKWEFRRNDTRFASGVLTTASDLLFTGATGDTRSGPVAARRSDGYFYAIDARTGQLQWKMALAGSIRSSPMTYAAGGTQYIAVTAGNLLVAFALRQ